jgi:GNAT superfamily N-acetyltransferase
VTVNLAASLQYRMATAADADAIARHRHFSELASPNDVRVYAAWVAEQTAIGRYIGCLAEHEGAVVAGAGVTLLEWGPVRGSASALRGRVANVYTDPSWRRQGIAGHLVRMVMAAARAAGVEVFNLAATHDSRRLYERLGFEPYPDEMICRRR